MKSKEGVRKHFKIIILTLLTAVLILCTGLATLAADTAPAVLSSVVTESPTLSADGSKIVLPSVPEGYTISIYGTSNESVIDE